LVIKAIPWTLIKFIEQLGLVFFNLLVDLEFEGVEAVDDLVCVKEGGFLEDGLHLIDKSEESLDVLEAKVDEIDEWGGLGLETTKTTWWWGDHHWSSVWRAVGRWRGLSVPFNQTERTDWRSTVNALSRTWKVLVGRKSWFGWGREGLFGEGEEMIRKFRDVDERMIVMGGDVVGGVAFTQVLVAIETVVRGIFGRISTGFWKISRHNGHVRESLSSWNSALSRENELGEGVVVFSSFLDEEDEDDEEDLVREEEEGGILRVKWGWWVRPFGCTEEQRGGRGRDEVSRERGGRQGSSDTNNERDEMKRERKKKW
jgi:hypothetical protein